MKNTKLAIIGGSGLDNFEDFKQSEAVRLDTPYGYPASGIKQGLLNDVPCVFLPRHGQQHEWPPHKVNYRANIHLLKQLGVESIIAINVVGGITSSMSPKTLVIPDQIIDYTYGREHTLYDTGDYGDAFAGGKTFEHIEFSYPYSPGLRTQLIDFLQRHNIPFVGQGTYGCTQGPRLETQAEISRLHRDGCDIVGMTAMPEAALARELGIDYVSICVVVNWAAGITKDTLEMESIVQVCAESMETIKGLLPTLCVSIGDNENSKPS